MLAKLRSGDTLALCESRVLKQVDLVSNLLGDFPHKEQQAPLFMQRVTPRRKRRTNRNEAAGVVVQTNFDATLNRFEFVLQVTDVEHPSGLFVLNWFELWFQY